MFFTYTRRKNAANTTLREILRRFCGSTDFCRLRHLLWHLLYQNFVQIVPQKRRKWRCRKKSRKILRGVMFAAFLRRLKVAKNEKITKSVYYVVGDKRMGCLHVPGSALFCLRLRAWARDQKAQGASSLGTYTFMSVAQGTAH